MRKGVLSFALLTALTGSSLGQSGAPQTARQALMEMFFSKTSGTFVKHLPTVTQAALEKSGAMVGFQQYSAMAAQLPMDGKNLQTFESGPVMLVATNPTTGDKVEIAVESDRTHGEIEDIAVAFHVTKNGQPQSAPFMPQLTFSMKQEEKVWKLNEVSVTIHLPLADPDFLKAVQEKMTPQVRPHVTLTAQSGPGAQVTPMQAPLQNAGSDAQVIAAMHTILAAEATYAERYPNVGYTCSLSSLDGFGGGEPNEHQAMLINSGLASGKKYGFVFTLTGCAEAPAGSFRLSAVPNANVSGRKTFCADQSGVMKSSEKENTVACFGGGSPVQ